MATLEDDWMKGNVTLGAAANWSSDEIRLVTELGYALAQQGRNSEAIAIFEGLAALSPATNYFDTALGALRLRKGDFEDAVRHLDRALKSAPEDIGSRVNRAEALIHLGRNEDARKDLEIVIAGTGEKSEAETSVTRGRALYDTLLETRFLAE
ncbi:MAG: tetratricopeptide repeat protein [Pyrinomonadaceae bacterium]